MKDRKREKGEVVVEASIIVTLVALFITILLYMSIVLYQKTLVSVMANQTASNIAQNYSNNLRDPFTGYIDTDKVYQSVTYSDMKTDAYKEVVERKAGLFAKYRLKSSRMLISENTTVDVKIIKKPNELLKNQVVVTIYDSYDVPLVGFFGENGLINFAASGRADCDDYLEYLNGVQAIGDPENSPIPSLPDSDTCLVTFLVDKLSGKYHAVVPVLRGKSIISSAHFSHSKMPDPPINNGLEFTGWITENGNPFSANDQINENLTVYGAWLCTISFDPTGGTVSPETMKVQLGKTVVFPVPTRYSYSFEGWFTQKDGHGIRYISDVTEIKSSVNLYAHWRCVHAEYTHEKISEGTCISRSQWKHTCKFCGYSYVDEGGYGTCKQGEYTDNYGPSCTTQGRQVAYCVYCDSLMVYKLFDALGHAWVSHYIAPTCTSDGESGNICSRCGTKDISKIPALGHNISQTVKNPTCTEDGYTKSECSTCHWTASTSINAHGHKWTSHIIQATETKKGFKGRRCTVCNLIEGHETCRLGTHTWGHCGEWHDYEDRKNKDGFNMPSTEDHAPYHKTLYFSCVVCTICHEYSRGVDTRGGWINLPDGTQGDDFSRDKWCWTCKKPHGEFVNGYFIFKDCGRCSECQWWRNNNTNYHK